MAVRTAAQLKTDFAAVITAIDAAIAAPSDTTANAIVAACNTVEANGRDSRGVKTHPSQSYGTDLRALAAAARKEVLYFAKAGLVGDANAYRRLKTDLVTDPRSQWNYYSTTAAA